MRRVDLRAWLGSRTPAPPEVLASRLARCVDSAGVGARDSATDHVSTSAEAEELVHLAERAMRGLLRDGCLTRQSALDLLAVDALLTYAFEAAAEDPDTLEALASSALSRIASLAEPYRA